MVIRQALASMTDLGERAITNGTGLGLVATNQATALWNRGMREVQDWGQFLRGHLVTSSIFVAGLAAEGTAIYMHRAHNEFCEDSVRAPCAELSNMTVVMYRIGLVCIIVSGISLFYILHVNRRLDQRPTPMVIQQPTVNYNARASLGPNRVVDEALVRGVLNSEATVKATMADLLYNESGAGNGISEEEPAELELDRKLAEQAQKMKAVNTPSAKAEGFSRLRGRLLLATLNVWQGLLGIGYPGYLFREPNFNDGLFRGTCLSLFRQQY